MLGGLSKWAKNKVIYQIYEASVNSGNSPPTMALNQKQYADMGEKRSPISP